MTLERKLYLHLTQQRGNDSQSSQKAIQFHFVVEWRFLDSPQGYLSGDGRSSRSLRYLNPHVIHLAASP